MWIIKYVFLLGLNAEMLQGTAGVRQRITERWLKFYDPRMAESSELLFFLFSQRMRHAAAQQVSLAFKGKRATALMKLIQTPGFDKRLERAAANPKKKDARALLRELEPLVRIAGIQTLWTDIFSLYTAMNRRVTHFVVTVSSLLPHMFNNIW